MLKNKEIIEKLTTAQKLSLVATGRFAPETDAPSNVPVVTAAALHEISKNADDIYPSFIGMANSWNCELIGGVTADLASRAKKDNVNAVITPDLSVKTHVYKFAMTESPYLAARFAAACGQGIARAGLTPVFAGCSVSGRDAEFMDTTPNEDVIRDYVVKPFKSALTESGCGAVMTSCSRLNGNYRDVNLSLINKLLRSKSASGKNTDNVHTVCDAADQDIAVASLNAGNTFSLGSDPVQFEAAYNNYLKLKESLEAGKITESELEPLRLSGAALSQAMLDSAADRFLDFATDCQKRALIKPSFINTAKAANALCAQAADESIVLMKNEAQTLPFKKGTKVAVIGQYAAMPGSAALWSESDLFTGAVLCDTGELWAYNPDVSFIGNLQNKYKDELRFKYMGYAPGYRLNEERSDELIPEACSLALSSDAVLLFLGICSCGEAEKGWGTGAARSLRLPVNQLALLDALKKTGKKIIAVIPAEYALDTSFDADCRALILLPSGGKQTNDALLRVLKGEVNPSGRLAYTFYNNPDEEFAELKKRKDTGRIKIGAFFGYRSYDIAGTKVRYPFGHGLSYTTFSYSGLKTNGLNLRFKVKNTGNMPGFETVQIYIGKMQSNIVRPLKELKGFRKIYLKPGQSKFVNMGFSYDDFAVCDPFDGQFKVETGEYTVYIGASVSDVRLEKSFGLNRKTFDLTGHEFVGKRENLSDYVDVCSNIISGGYTLKTGNADWQAPPPRQNETVIAGTPPFEKLFLEEFVEAEEPDSQGDEAGESSGESEDVAAYIDKGMTMKAAAIGLTTFMRESGIMLNSQTARAVLSAMSASRLIILKASDGAGLIKGEFVRHLSLYFGSPFYMDDVSGFGEGMQMLKRYENEIYTTPDLANALKAASQSRHLIHIAALSGLDFAGTDELIMPILSYAAGTGYKFAAKDSAKNNSRDNPDDGAAKAFAIPPNVWFVLVPKIGSPDNIPPYIAENAVTINLKLSKTGKKSTAQTLSPVRQMNYYQFLNLSSDSENRYSASETTWKKLDKLEEWVNARAPYQIKNKEWRQIEKYMSAYLACEGGTDDSEWRAANGGGANNETKGVEAEAAESVVYAKLLPSIIHIIKTNAPNGDDDLALMLEKILGQE